MKLSLIISVFQSYEIVRRQTLYLASMRLPVDIEIILVDDGSIPPLDGRDYTLPNLRILATGNKLAWTQGLGRNLGVEHARGEYVFLTDLDHILSREALEVALVFTGKKMIFRRQIAILDEWGRLTQERAALQEWGYERESLAASVHGNTFVMPRADFLALGGYAPETCTRGYHPVSKQGDDCYFNAKWNRANRGYVPVLGPDIYLFPIGRFHKAGDLNPFGYFHNLHQREEVSHKYG